MITSTLQDVMTESDEFSIFRDFRFADNFVGSCSQHVKCQAQYEMNAAELQCDVGQAALCCGSCMHFHVDHYDTDFCLKILLALSPCFAHACDGLLTCVNVTRERLSSVAC